MFILEKYNKKLSKDRMDKSYSIGNNSYQMESNTKQEQRQKELNIDTETNLVTKKWFEIKLSRIFREFSFSSFTFYLFLLNCITWIAVHAVYWGGVNQWDCVQYYFFAKFQPSITYNYEFWRLIFSSLMFRGGIQFYFNNFSLNMMGYIFEKQSKVKFLIIFYGGILSGHMLSCCLNGPEVLTVGTSCGTIALLPIEICRFIRLRRTNPIQAESRLKFLVFNILSNFILNILAVFHLDTVDWISHVGCIISGLMFLAYYEIKNYRKNNQFNKQFTPNRQKLAKMLQYGCLVLYLLYIAIMAMVIWIALPKSGRGKEQLQKIYFLCNSNS